MLFAHLATAVTVAGLGRAFLLPPTTVSSANKEIIDTLSFKHVVVEMDERVLDLNCPGCPVFVPEVSTGRMTSLQMENQLRLNFSISHQDSDRLLLNGFPIYPIGLDWDPLSQPLTAPQIVHVGAQHIESVPANPMLSFQLLARRPNFNSEEDQLELLELRMQIVKVADQFVNDIDIVELKLLHTPSGKLMIGDLQTTQSEKSYISALNDAGKECTSIICKWRAIIADKLSKIKGCNGKARPAGGPTTGSVTRPKHQDHGHDHPHGHGSGQGSAHPHGAHRPHRYHHRRSGFARFLRSIVLHVFIPIVIGIVAGVTASLVGMVVGHIAIFLWRSFFRRGHDQRQYHKLRQDEAMVEDSNEETKRFLPPSYEEAIIEEKASE